MAATLVRAGDLARGGQHAQAIELVTPALAAPGLAATVRMDLLDLRVESFVAQGDLEHAAADAATMLALARTAKTAAFKAQAGNRNAQVEIRKGQFKAAIGSATVALEAARRSRQQRLIATSLFRLAEAQYRLKPGPQVLRYATEAVEIFKGLGDPSGEGRALWIVSMMRGFQGRAADGNQAAREALALCRSCGDLYGAGNALNMLVFHEADLGASLKLSSQALADFEAGGYVERQAVVTANRGITYASLGLHRHARRLYLKADGIYRRIGAQLQRRNVSLSLAEAEFAMGHFDAALGHTRRLAEIRDELAPQMAANLGAIEAHIALASGDPNAALRSCERALQITRENKFVSSEIDVLTIIGQARLVLGNPRAALAATRRATEMHRAHDLATLDGMSPALTWWTHSRALQANKQAGPAREALEMAYRFMLHGIAGLSDEGLRRNFLNKIATHREIVRAWLKDSRKRRLSHDRQAAHLVGEASLREPFERLVDTGLRLNELRSAPELHEFLIDEATELCGAERVLLVLESADGLQLAGSVMPRGEDANALLRDVTPAFAQAKRTRAVTLDYAPETAGELDQCSRIVAPLVAQRQLLGYLYADLDGAFGRFREADRDLLGMLASQGAVAVANAQWSQGLEQKVEERTRALQASNAELEQRAGELAIINSIQQGIAAELDFQAIVDLVGDKLRETFNTGDLSITWYDPRANLVQYLYIYEHGNRLQFDPRPPRSGGTYEQLLKTRLPTILNSRAAMLAAGVYTIPGTDTACAMIDVPIIGSDRVLGSLSVENHEREHAFGESEARLLSTVAASMGVALENARLFDETQRLFKAEQERAAELQIINSIQQGLASKLDLQAIVDLVGEKLRDILATEDIGIRLYDEKTGLVHYLYEFEHGERLSLPPQAPSAMFRQQQADRISAGASI